jgi:hypothetical protein
LISYAVNHRISEVAVKQRSSAICAGRQGAVSCSCAQAQHSTGTARQIFAILLLSPQETYFRDCEERLTQSQERPDAEILYSFENAADMAAALGISTSVAIKLYNKLNEAKRRRLVRCS